jgi:hypothetical protein
MPVKKYTLSPIEKDLLRALLSIRAKPQNFDMIADRILIGMPLSRVSKRYGVSANWVHKLEKRVNSDIRRVLKQAVKERIMAMEKVGRYRESEYNRIKEIS